MNTPRSGPTINAISKSYQVTRQGLFNLRKVHGLTVSDLAEPDTVLSRLLENGRRSPLRTRLLDAETRESIRRQLQA